MLLCLQIQYNPSVITLLGTSVWWNNRLRGELPQSKKKPSAHHKHMSRPINFNYLILTGSYM